MSSSIRKAAVGVAALSAAMSSTGWAQAAPQTPIIVGVLDCAGDRMTYKEPGVDIVYREFTVEGHKPGRWKTLENEDHGRVVVTSTVRELRRLEPHAPIRIYSANAFSMKETPKGMALAVSTAKAIDALRWMSENGVKVVVTAFNLGSADASKPFMDKAESLGMTVFAASSNAKNAGLVYPAADPRSISIADTTDGESSLTKDASVATWVKFAMNGAVGRDRTVTRMEDNGASFASAKAGAWGAYYSWRNPEAKREEIESALGGASAQRDYLAWTKRVTMRTLGEQWAVERFRTAAAAAAGAASATRVASLLKGPRSVVEEALPQKSVGISGR